MAPHEREESGYALQKRKKTHTSNTNYLDKATYTTKKRSKGKMYFKNRIRNWHPVGLRKKEFKKSFNKPPGVFFFYSCTCVPYFFRNVPLTTSNPIHLPMLVSDENAQKKCHDWAYVYLTFPKCTKTRGNWPTSITNSLHKLFLMKTLQRKMS